MCVCVVIPFILDVRLVDAPAGVPQEEGHTGFLHLPSAVLALRTMCVHRAVSKKEQDVDWSRLTTAKRETLTHE